MHRYRYRTPTGRATRNLIEYYSLENLDDIMLGWETKKSLGEFERELQEVLVDDYNHPSTTRLQNRLVEDSHFDWLLESIEQVEASDKFRKQPAPRIHIKYQERAPPKTQDRPRMRPIPEIISLVSPTPAPMRAQKAVKAGEKRYIDEEDESLKEELESIPKQKSVKARTTRYIDEEDEGLPGAPVKKTGRGSGKTTPARMPARRSTVLRHW